MKLRFRLSLRTMFILVTLAGLGTYYWFVLPTNNAHRLRQAAIDNDKAAMAELLGEDITFYVSRPESVYIAPLTWQQLWHGERFVYVLNEFTSSRGRGGIFEHQTFRTTRGRVQQANKVPWTTEATVGIYARPVFAKYDKNGDGFLTGSESDSLYSGPTKAADVDTNGDGRVSAVEYVNGGMLVLPP